MQTLTTIRVAAAALMTGDRFEYSGVEVECREVTALGTEHVEVRVYEMVGMERERFLDYGVRETVVVTYGPSIERAQADAVAAAAAKPVASVSLLARNAVRAGRVRTLPASAALVLYAAAAAQDEAGSGFAPTVSSVALGAGLAVSTTAGHLRSLAAKGLVHVASDGSVTVTA